MHTSPHLNHILSFIYLDKCYSPATGSAILSIKFLLTTEFYMIFTYLKLHNFLVSSTFLPNEFFLSILPMSYNLVSVC
jgi:hypothetical protein